LGHEGEGSLYQRLKREGWTESLSSGVANVDENNSLIVLNIDLTETGYANLKRVNDLTFRYIELLKQSPPESWRYAEQARVAELGFRFQEKSSATGFVYRTAPAFMHYPASEVLVAPYLMSGFDASLIDEFLARLNVDNVIVEISGPDVPVDSLEPWFQVPYKLVSGAPPGALESATDSATPAGLNLPVPNPYLPADLQVLEDDGKLPELRYESPGLALWEDRDTSFGSPRANLFLSLGIDRGIQSAEDLAMASIYRSLVADSLSAEVYPAYLAGLGYGIDVNGLGFELSVSGYSDKQLVLLRTVLNGLTRLEIDPERFSAFKNELLREWGNYRDERPYTQTYGALSYLLLSSRWPPEALIAELEKRDLEDLQRWRAERMSGFNVVGLQTGNVTDLEGHDLVGLLKSELPLKNFPRVEPSVKSIDSAWRHQLPIDHQDASIVLYLQDPDSAITSRATSALAGQMIKQSYFTSLRTEQQLGYVVSVTAQTIRDRGGLAFIVQSPVASPAKLEALTREFLNKELNAVAQMGEEEFQRFQSGLVGQLTEKDRNLGERSRRYWTNLQLGITTFDTRQRIAAAATDLSKDDVLTYLRQLVARFDQERLIVFNRGRFEDTPQGGRELIDVAGFKSAG
jgi:secreted Zn-dependent insulinase-like peptidase